LLDMAGKMDLDDRIYWGVEDIMSEVVRGASVFFGYFNEPSDTTLADKFHFGLDSMFGEGDSDIIDRMYLLVEDTVGAFISSAASPFSQTDTSNMRIPDIIKYGIDSVKRKLGKAVSYFKKNKIPKIALLAGAGFLAGPIMDMAASKKYTVSNKPVAGIGSVFEADSAHAAWFSSKKTRSLDEIASDASFSDGSSFKPFVAPSVPMDDPDWTVDGKPGFVYVKKSDGTRDPEKVIVYTNAAVKAVLNMPVSKTLNNVRLLSEYVHLLEKKDKKGEYEKTLTPEQIADATAVLARFQGKERSKVYDLETGVRAETFAAKHFEEIVKRLCEETGKPTVLYIFGDDNREKTDKQSNSRGFAPIIRSMQDNYGDKINVVGLKIGNWMDLDQKLMEHIDKFARKNYSAIVKDNLNGKFIFPAVLSYDKKGECKAITIEGVNSEKLFYEWYDKFLAFLPNDVGEDGLYKERAFDRVNPRDMYSTGTKKFEKGQISQISEVRISPHWGRGVKSDASELYVHEDVRWYRCDDNEFKKESNQEEYWSGTLKPVKEKFGLEAESFKKLAQSISNEKTYFFDATDVKKREVGIALIMDLDKKITYCMLTKPGIALAYEKADTKNF